MESSELSPPFGRLLRFWRTTFGYSQEALSAAVGVSARHLSFLENGRSNPGKQLVLDLASVFELAHRDTNNLLVAAGLVPLDASSSSDNDRHLLYKSLVFTLQALDPTPACIADPCGDIQMVNRSWVHFNQRYKTSLDPDQLTNTYHAFFSEKALRPHLESWENVACALLMNLQQEVLLTSDSRAQQVLDELLQYPGIPANWPQKGREVAYNHSFRFRIKMPGDTLPQTYVAVNHTVGVTPYVSQPRLIITCLKPLQVDQLPAITELADITHPQLAV